MNDPQVESIIQVAEKQAGNSSFVGARLMGGISVLFATLTFLGGEPLVFVSFAGACGIVTASMWRDGYKFKCELTYARAQALWTEIERRSGFGDNPTLKERQLLKEISSIYQRDPQGNVLPIQHAVRLVLAWKQQQKRLRRITVHVEELTKARAELLEKDRQLRALNDRSTSVERAIEQLNDDIAPLKRSGDLLRASCARLEALVVEADASVRRRQLHREVGEMTTRLPAGSQKLADPFGDEDDHRDFERQIGREIETYMQLERETEAHLRDL